MKKSTALYLTIDGLGVGCLPQFGQAIACLEI
jgi:hypothetical protein